MYVFELRGTVCGITPDKASPPQRPRSAVERQRHASHWERMHRLPSAAQVGYVLSVRRNDENVSFPFLLKRFFSVSLPFLSTVSLPFLLLTVSFPFPPFLFRFFWEYREVFSQLEASPFLYRFFTVSFPFLYRFFSVSFATGSFPVPPFLFRFFP